MPWMPPLATRRLALLAVLCAPSAWATPGLAIEYRDKPPYSYTEGGKPAGFLMERTQQILQKAGLAPKYTEVPIRRTLMRLQGNLAPLCTPGLYKLPDREAYARFSLPIHRDKPHVVIAHADVAPQIRALRRISALFADASLQPGVLDGVSYGPQLDEGLANTAKPAMRAQLTVLQLARMVGQRRMDYMLIDEEDLAWLKRDPEFAALGLVRIEFADMPRGELRYIACSRQVPAATMQALNRAIRELLPELQAE